MDRFNFNNEKPTNPDEIVNQTAIEDLDKLAIEKGAKLPKDWDDFDTNAKRRAVASLLRGGLTPLGFETLTPDWLDRVKEVGDAARAGLEEIKRIRRNN